MKRLFYFIWLAGALTACQTKATRNQKSTSLQQQVDSQVGIRMEELNRSAMEDLDRRMSIEVKVKADSIVEARLHGVTDTSSRLH